MPAIARAFTTKRVKMSLELAQEAKKRAAMQRSNTTKAAYREASDSNGTAYAPAFRPKISEPLELIHTTNMLSYNAPDLPRTSTSASSDTSTKSEDEPDSPATATSSPPTSPDVATGERPTSPEPNHLSCYFVPPSQPAAAAPAFEPPAIPQRAPSHTKKASYEALSRQRSNSVLSNTSRGSVSTKASYTFSRSSSASTSTSTTSHTSMSSQIPKMPPTPVVPAIPATPVASAVPRTSYERPRIFHERPREVVREVAPDLHPFGQELARVSEMAKEFGYKDRLQVIDEEEQDLLSRGFCKFSADTYLLEIQGLSSMFFSNEPTHQRPMAAVWI